ncbi:MAG: hypothetical protein ABWX62_09195 [Microterricola sp.]
MGGTHTLDDIVDLIREGHMQSFCEGETWAITQIIQFPQKRILEIFLVVGDMPEAEKLHDQVVAFAKEHDCQMVRCFGRDGWSKWAVPRGWTNGQRVYMKEI